MLVKALPYLIISSFNFVLELLFPEYKLHEISVDILILANLNFFFITRLSNGFNKILSGAWLAFFFLGILNINSVLMRTSIWNLKLHEASLLYHLSLLVFICGLLFFEKSYTQKYYEVPSETSFKRISKGPFFVLLLVFPILLVLDVYLNIGFFPILTGQSFVDKMYEYNYGVLYNFKFICVYTFCLIFLVFGKRKLLSSIYILFLLFAVSIDGKRFILLLSIISVIPILIYKKNTGEYGKINYAPIIAGSIAVGFSYILINILRSGGDIQASLYALIEHIPFGVEFKDYVHSINTYEIGEIPNYNYELSSLGSFLNSSILEVFGLDKTELYQLGSQHAWMELYNEKFGIRLGIIAELYFAYGYLVLPAMFVLSYFVNVVNQRLINPKTYFNLFQNSILFGLFFLLINGQSTVFFGILTLMIYFWLLYRILLFIYPQNRKESNIAVYE